MDDELIRHLVEDTIDNDPSISPRAKIDVNVKSGVVTLTGTVSNKQIKHAAGDDAWWLPQVIDVHNQIGVVSRRERMATASPGQSSETRRASRRGQTTAHAGASSQST
jgi:hypothetical protein